MSAKTITAEARQEAIDRAQSTYGFVPNLMQAMADGNPVTLHAYLDGSAVIGKGVLTHAEQQAVMLAISAYNSCHYCTAAHRTIGKGAGIDGDDLVRIDRGENPQDERLAALVIATRRLLDQRGFLDDDDQSELAELGVDRAQLYEIITIVGLKTITNYVNHLARTEIDPPFQAEATRQPGQAT
ncbi:MAG: carboxymuconolactone decarboxylase family protein [Acidobacteriota bacterium]